MDTPPPPDTSARLCEGVRLTRHPRRKNPAYKPDTQEKENLIASVQIRADSLAALVRWITSEAGKPKAKFANDPSSREPHQGKEGMDWDLGAGWQGALDLANNGWPEGRKKMGNALASLAGDFVLTPPPDFDVSGGTLCTPSFIAGDPCHFETDAEDLTGGKSKIVRLIVPLSASCGVSAKALCNRGAAIASVIDALENGGHSVEVETHSVHHDTHKGENQQTVIRHLVKEAGAALSLDRLAVSLAHPATFRRIHFAAIESIGDLTDPVTVDELRRGYGNPRSDHRKDLNPVGSYELPKLSDAENGESAFETPDSARKEIARQLGALGFTVSFAA
jgi:hypothetical protein